MTRVSRGLLQQAASSASLCKLPHPAMASCLTSNARSAIHRDERGGSLRVVIVLSLAMAAIAQTNVSFHWCRQRAVSGWRHFPLQHGAGTARRSRHRGTLLSGRGNGTRSNAGGRNAHHATLCKNHLLPRFAGPHAHRADFSAAARGIRGLPDPI